MMSVFRSRKAPRSGSGDTTTPASGGLTTELVPFRPPAPQAVLVTAGSDPGTAVVTWQPVEVADVHYQVRPQSGATQPQNTAETTAMFAGLVAGDPGCFTVVAITADGRLSDDSALSCLP